MTAGKKSSSRKAPFSDNNLFEKNEIIFENENNNYFLAAKFANCSIIWYVSSIFRNIEKSWTWKRVPIRIVSDTYACTRWSACKKKKNLF